MRRGTMEYTVDKERVVYDIEHVVCYDSEDSDDLTLARGIFNGFIIEVVAAVFIVAVIAAI
jgi:hypothetical protein